LECEVFHSGFPFVTEFDENGSDESEEGCFVGEECGDSGTAFEFSVLSFEHVGGPHSFSVLSGYSEDRQSFGDVGFGPGGQFRCGIFVAFDKAAEFFGGVVDIGANMGLFALWMSPQIGSGRICCVEPTSAYDTLSENVRLNNLSNVHTIRCAAGHSDSTLEILEYPEFNGVNHNAEFTPAPWGQFFIRLLHRRKPLPPVRTSHPCRDLASILDEVSFDKVDLLKIDCEGGEYEILNATSDDVLSRVDRVCMEFHELHESHDHRNMVKRLEGCGFQVTVERPWFERVFQKTGSIWAIRPSK
jgi:FkbM family methyltransferase